MYDSESKSRIISSTYTYTRTHIHTYIHTHIHIYTHTHIQSYTHTHTIQVCMFAHVVRDCTARRGGIEIQKKFITHAHTCTHAHTRRQSHTLSLSYAHMYIRIHNHVGGNMNVCIYILINIYTYIHIYMHVYMHTESRTAPLLCRI